MSSIAQFKEQKKFGSRVFSSPLDSDAMKYYENAGDLNAKLVGIEVYCDGTVLSSSNTQSAAMLRVRFGNIKGRSEHWHNVGIIPTYRDFGEILSKSKRECGRLELFQRYLFLAWRDLIKASASGFVYEGKTILPRIMITVADQPQKRQFFALKKVGSFRDCSLCLMISPVPRQRYREGPNVRRSEPIFGESDCENFVRGASTDEERNKDSDSEFIYNEQTTMYSAPKRNVSETVRSQLLLARSALKRNLSATESDVQKRQNARKYL